MVLTDTVRPTEKKAVASKVIYEVNASIDPQATEQFAEIVKSHIKTITALPGFTHAEWFERKASDETNGDPNRVHWTIHYHAKDRASVDNYFNGLAPKLRAETHAMGAKVVAQRRVLSIKI